MAKIYGNITATPIKPDLFTTTVDQTYDPESENAQSGKAVSELELKIPLVDYTYNQDSQNAQSGMAVREAIEVAKSYTDSKIDQVPDYQSENAVSNKAMMQYVANEVINTEQFAKDYTDEKIGDIETALDSILAIQNSYIGGDA